MRRPPGEGRGSGVRSAHESAHRSLAFAAQSWKEEAAPASERRPTAAGARKPDNIRGWRTVRVIASSLRKGNVVDIDNRLYVILSAENIHPGKGTPVTQVDMRRISDGTKVSERWRTTEQVERAHVEDREYTFLYEDGEGFHFMNSETYDQL
ncbi:MAG: hypothetical protein JOZ88_05090, partial [Hyphomicrobiales bacterium]|nr:hypothetical protein [Hyphomicrobiales bacterium]